MAIPLSQLPGDLLYNGQLDVSNPDKQSKYNQLNAQWEQGNGGASGGVSGGVSVSDPIAQAKAINDFYVQQNQPAIQSIQSQIPKTQQLYENQAGYLKSQQAPLEARYKSLIDSITKSTQTETSQEFGKRGVSTESGLYDQTLNNRLNPQISQLGISQGQDVSSLLNQIAQLTGQGDLAVGNLNTQIAQLQAGNAPQALSSAQAIIDAATQQKQFDVGTELKKQELAQSNTTDLSKYFTSLAPGSTLYDLLNNKALYTAPKTDTTGSGSSGWE